MMQKATANMTAKKANTTKAILAFNALLVLIGLFGFTTLAYTAKPPDNILKNGDFDLNLEGWHHWTHETAAVLFQTEGKKAEPSL